MADIAGLITYIKANNLYGINPKAPWLTMGNSYAG
jgi:hypothetical protein